MSEEGLNKTLNKKIFISSVLPSTVEEMEEHLDTLRALVIDRVGGSGEEVAETLAHVVPTFNRYVPPHVEVAANVEQSAKQ